MELTNKILPESGVWFHDCYSDGNTDPLIEYVNNTTRQGVLILGTDFTQPNTPDDVFSQKRIFKNILPLIEKYLQQIKSGEVKLIFYLQDFWSTRCDWEIDGEINTGGIHTYDIYNWVYPQLVELGIVHNSCFLSPLPLEGVSVHKDFPLYNYNYSFNIYLYLKQFDIKVNSKHTNKFLWLNRRPRDHRIYALYKMHQQNILEDCVWSFNVYDENNAFDDSFVHERIQHLTGEQTNIQLPQPIDDIWTKENDAHLYSMLTMQRTHQMYGSVWLDVISEYNYSDHRPFIDEKIAKSIVLKKPFVVFADRHFLRQLKSQGFKTFDSFWNESYDDLIGYQSRIDSAVNTLKYIQHNIDTSGYSEEMQEILEYNHWHYFNTYREQQMHTIEKIIQ